VKREKVTYKSNPLDDGFFITSALLANIIKTKLA